MQNTARISTLKLRLQGSCDLIDNDLFLPMFRNRQIKYEKLYEFSIGVAKEKKRPSHYFASIWSPKNLKKTLEMLQKMINKAKTVAAKLFWTDKKAKEDEKIRKERAKHAEELAVLEDLKAMAFGFRTPEQVAKNRAKKRRK